MRAGSSTTRTSWGVISTRNGGARAPAAIPNVVAPLPRNNLPRSRPRAKGRMSFL